jgi:hypothetical protein
MNFANFEIKVLVAYMVTNIDYEVDQELLDRDDVGFGLNSEVEAKFTIK